MNRGPVQAPGKSCRCPKGVRSLPTVLLFVSLGCASARQPFSQEHLEMRDYKPLSVPAATPVRERWEKLQQLAAAEGVAFGNIRRDPWPDDRGAHVQGQSRRSVSRCGWCCGRARPKSRFRPRSWRTGNGTASPHVRALRVLAGNRDRDEAGPVAKGLVFIPMHEAPRRRWRDERSDRSPVER